MNALKQTVVLSRELADAIIGLAKENYPNEFIALIHGKLGKEIVCDYLLYQTFHSSPDAATMLQGTDFPMLAGSVGSVHSHPGPNRPSHQDLMMFDKSGAVHIIIGRPYSEENIAVYDKEGKKLVFSIK